MTIWRAESEFGFCGGMAHGVHFEGMYNNEKEQNGQIYLRISCENTSFAYYILQMPK